MNNRDFFVPLVAVRSTWVIASAVLACNRYLDNQLQILRSYLLD